MKSLLTIAIAALVGCGAPIDDEQIGEPDVWFSWEGEAVPTDIGQTEQAWTSSEYYGKAKNSPCYAQTDPNADCSFPSRKNAKTTFAMCPRTDPSLRSAGIFALYQGFSAGVLDWNGTGGIAVSNSATNAIPVNVSCDPTLTPGALAETETTAIRTQVDDLPLLPNGHDAKRARQYDSAAIRFDPILTYKHYLNVCHLPDNDIDLSDFARYGGRHEMGHAMGFAHVSSSTELMNAFQQCSLSLASINAKYGTALANYNGSTGRVAIRTDNLPH